jgi:hypothetical protein
VVIRGRADNNQAEIVAALRSLGATVQILSSVGKGCPDLLIGHAGFNILIEVKNDRNQLTEDQVKWHSTWKGQSVYVVHSIDEALYLIFGITRH